MKLPTPSEREMARWLLARAGVRVEVDGPAKTAEAALLVLERMHSRLGWWFGSDSVEVLFRRAAVLARLEYPAGGATGDRQGSEHPVRRLGERLRAYPPAEAAAALLAMTEAFLGLLTRMVGYDIALHLMERSLPEEPREGPRSEDEGATS